MSGLGSLQVGVRLAPPPTDLTVAKAAEPGGRVPAEAAALGSKQKAEDSVGLGWAAGERGEVPGRSPGL